MPTFLTVREAAKQTGKSPSSIRRVLYPILQNDKHPDRKHIEPSVEDALKLRVKGESFAWRLSEELLRREVPIEPGTVPGNAASGRLSSGHGDGELLAMLRRELDIKNQQITLHGELIAKQMELISGLSERLREGNILIGSLQQQLALTDGREAKPTEPVNAKTTPPKKADKAPPTPPKASKPKRGFLFRLFH
jgi:hypothetical protein